ncbi:hypothetical protein [Winogradskyella immobilis]|uniref:DUF4476 domain-containing protein n=1 Tax=Winogradskyella immobilis TaxID=2816852 RepID=A0ABS8EM80_9FLAO|nr:hypothetical protein [Winogradskyella immobilis]MCC1484200.1 hypothetical protein [Winogradskyella immobilis]MCG0016292.1 hypothetical protein [Winogradskyella immobilis]
MKKLAITLFSICLSLTFAQAQLVGGGDPDPSPFSGGAPGSPLDQSTITRLNTILTQPGLNVIINGVASEAVDTREFTPARIVSKGESIIMPTRINILSNNIEIKNPEGQIFELKKEEGISLSFIDSRDRYRTVAYVNKKGNKVVDYFLYEKDAVNQNLLKKADFKYIKAKLSSTSYEKDRPAYFEQSYSYFYKTKNNSLIDLAENKKSIAKQFGSNSKNVLAFIKENKIDNKNESDLLKLANYMSTLEK